MKNTAVFLEREDSFQKHLQRGEDTGEYWNLQTQVGHGIDQDSARKQ